MRRFEFVVAGVPKSATAKSKPKWQERVVAAAKSRMPDDWQLLAEPVTAVIVHFHRDAASGVDMDNLSKPILDALKKVLIVDDAFVVQLIARRTHLRSGLTIWDVTPELAKGLAGSGDFVFVRIDDPPDHGHIP